MSAPLTDRPPPLPDALVLCGGKSRRFGSDKARAVVGGRTIIERVVGALRPVSRRVVLVADRRERFADLDLPVIEDDAPYGGPLRAMANALARIDAEAAFVASCDMPFLMPELFALEARRLGDADACVPWDGRHWAPLAALYRRSVAAEAERLVASGAERLMDLLPRLRLARLAPEDLRSLPGNVLWNVNTAADARRAGIQAGSSS